MDRFEAALGSRPRSALLQTRQGPLQYCAHGDGPALLAIHGGMGGYDQSLLLAEALLGRSSGRRVIALSRPGYLGSPLGDCLTPEAQADLYAEVLDALGVEKATVAAVSAGGLSALQFAIRHPSRCAALVLVSACSGRLSTPPAILSRLRVMRLLALIPGLPTLLRSRVRNSPERALTRSIPDAATRARVLAHPDASRLMLALQDSVFDALSRRIAGTINDVERFATQETLPLERIAAPTLVIHGAADGIVTPRHGQRVADAVPESEMLSIPDGTHVALFTHLDIVRARVATFLGT